MVREQITLQLRRLKLEDKIREMQTTLAKLRHSLQSMKRRTRERDPR